MSLGRQYTEPDVEWQQTKGNNGVWRTLVRSWGVKTETFAIEPIGDSERRERQERQWDKNIEVQHKVEKIKVPW